MEFPLLVGGGSLGCALLISGSIALIDPANAADLEIKEGLFNKYGEHESSYTKSTATYAGAVEGAIFGLIAALGNRDEEKERIMGKRR